MTSLIAHTSNIVNSKIQKLCELGFVDFPKVVTVLCVLEPATLFREIAAVTLPIVAIIVTAVGARLVVHCLQYQRTWIPQRIDESLFWT